MTIGERIKSARLLQEMSQDDVARALKTSRQAIYKYENGIITNIPLEKLEAIANVLHVSPAYLLGWEENKTSRKEMKIGEFLKKYREEKSISQRQLAVKCNVSNGYISMLEEGVNPRTNEPIVPTLTTLKKISTAIDIPLQDLMEMIDDMPLKLTHSINNDIIGNQNNNNTITVGAEPSGEIETELISLCRKMNMQQKNKLLTCAYDILGE